MSHETQTTVPFPLYRRVADVREAALTIKSLESDSAMKWWKSRARILADQMAASGVPEHVITGEICQFQDAVFRDLATLY
jgi:hypothetical protein